MNLERILVFQLLPEPETTYIHRSRQDTHVLSPSPLSPLSLTHTNTHIHTYTQSWEPNSGSRQLSVLSAGICPLNI